MSRAFIYRICRNQFYFCMAVLMCSNSLLAQEKPAEEKAVAERSAEEKDEKGRIHYQIPFSTATPIIDGQISAAEWNSALKVQLTNETHPRDNIPALVDTDVYVMEDGGNLLLAFVAHDPEPDKIRAFYRDRDNSFQDDFVGIVIDTFNDERRAYEFFSNPLGIQMDLTNDDVNGNEDSSWNAIWDSAGQINDSGYVVEMRIPLKQIRFPSGIEQQTWGVDFLRFYPRDVRHRLSNNTWDFDLSCYLCQLKKARGFPEIEQSTNLQVIPAVTTQYSKSRPEPETQDWQAGKADYDAGVDVRWGINEDIVLNATINPDFSQVEADSIQLDVNETFTLFFPERREFFIEGADYFNTQTNLLYTRNIQDPDAGVKLTGKSGNHSYGLMLANDQSTAFVVPGLEGSNVEVLDDTSSEDFALRNRYDYGRNITLGSLITRRQSKDYENNLAAIDFNWRFSDSDRVHGQAMYSDTDNPEATQSEFTLDENQRDEAWRLVYSHQGEHFRLNVRGFYYGEDFRADLGFINRVGYRHYNINPSYVWRQEEGSFLTDYGLWGFANLQEDLAGRQIEKVRRTGFWLNGPMQSYMEAGFGTNDRVYQNTEFDLKDGFIFFRIQPWGGADFSINLNSGETIDFANLQKGDFLTVSPGISLQLGRHLLTQLNYTYQNLDVGGDRLYKTNLLDLRITYQFSTRSYIRAIASKADTHRNPLLYLDPVDERSKSLSTQLLYSYRFNGRTRFFVGYSSGGFADDALGSIHDTNRTIFAKFTYAWQI